MHKVMRMSIIFCLSSILLSCNQSVTVDLKGEVETLLERNDNLESQVQALEIEVEALKRKLSEASSETWDLRTELEVCQKNYQEYKYGSGTCLTMLFKGQGRTTICGAENIITMLRKDYCPYNCRYSSDY